MFDCYNVLMMFFKSATKVLFFLHICKKKCTFRNFKCIFLIPRVNFLPHRLCKSTELYRRHAADF